MAVAAASIAFAVFGNGDVGDKIEKFDFSKVGHLSVVAGR